MAAISEQELRDIFDSFDADHSGHIDAKELVNALKKVFGDKSDDEINELAGSILIEADSDSDKKISWEEFQKAASS